MSFDEEEAVLEVSRRLKVPYASRENAILRMEQAQDLDRLIPKDVALRETVLPLFLHDGTLAVALVDPRDAALIERLWRSTGCLIQPHVSTRAQIVDAIERSYR